MTLADALTAVAKRAGGLSVLDLSENVFNIDAKVPDLDLTGSVWPMPDEAGWWFVHGFAGKHRKSKTYRWLVECLTCGYEQTLDSRRLIGQRRRCDHGLLTTTNNPKENA